MARERSNQVCVILDNTVISTLNEEVERTKSSRSGVIANWINAYFHTEQSLKEYKSQIDQLRQDIEILQDKIQKRDEQLQDLQLLKEDTERLKLELQNKDNELKNLKEKARELNQLQIQIGKLQIELIAKDNDIKRLEDNLGYLRFEHSKLREEIAAPLTRLLTATTEENKIKKWWQFWKRKAAGA